MHSFGKNGCRANPGSLLIHNIADYQARYSSLAAFWLLIA